MTRNIQSVALIAIFLMLAPSIRAQNEANSVTALKAAQASFTAARVVAWNAAKNDPVDIKSIGNLSLMLIHVKGGDKIPEKYYLVFNPNEPKVNPDTTASKVNPDTTESKAKPDSTAPKVSPLTFLPTTVVAKYKFPGDGELLDLPLNQPIELPSSVHMFQVEFSWPNGDGPKEACHLIASPEQKCPCAQGHSPQADPNGNIDGQNADKQSDTKCCFLEAVFLRDLTKNVTVDETKGLTQDQNDALKNSEIGNLVPAVVLNQYNMLVSTELIEESQNRTFPTFVINGFSLKDYFSSGSYYGAINGNPNYVARSGWSLGRYFYFQIFPPPTSCSRNDSGAAKNSLQVDRFPLTKNTKKNTGWVDNGIRSDQPKVYDVYSLRQMLATTASQLAGIAGFNPASINAAVGNLQGVTSDVSYLSAQATTVATPTVSSLASNGTTGNNTTANSSGQNAALSGSTSTIQCPAGTLPGIGTSGLPACVPLVTSSSYTTGVSGNPIGLTGGGNNSGGSSTYGTSTNSSGSNSSNGTTNVLGTSQLNSTTTTSGGQAGTIAAVPVSNAFSAPTNVGVASQDILAEQVQLNSQITTLQMALQGSLSDQYLVKEGKVVSTRQQTTLGFNINIDPPRRYKHAVAEVRIWVYPGRPDDSMSVVNLLPAAKTYNVAKITSNQKAFGAGVVIDPVNVGAAAGKSKNRLYLAKDTDTVALQYYPNSNTTNPEWTKGASLVGPSVQEHGVDVAHVLRAWQEIGNACADDPAPDLPANGHDYSDGNLPLVFGWQFRPVLGAEYVQSGDRQVFAQVALPVGLGER